jgi:hypothetical protein
MVVAEIDGVRVTLDQGEWSTKDEILARAVLLYTDSYWIVDGSYAPDRDLAIMQYVLEITGGEIIEHTPPEHVEGRVY